MLRVRGLVRSCLLPVLLGTLLFPGSSWSVQDPERPLDRLYDTDPQTRNSPLIATPEAVKLQAFTGGASFGFPLTVPPGTGGATPSLALTYSSLSKNGAYGWGWSLGLSRIERCTRFGPPSYVFNEDEFELDGEVLVRDPVNPNRFHKRNYDFTRIVYRPESNTWEVTAPDGTRFFYGNTARKAGLTFGFASFRWALDEVIDPDGNSYRIEYQVETDPQTGLPLEIYPRTIRYSFHESASQGSMQGKRLVRFFWGARRNGSEEEDLPTSYRSRFKIQVTKRLTGVSTGIDADGDGLLPPQDSGSGEKLTAGYAFDYAPKPSAANPNQAIFSKLVTIHRFGTDGSIFPSSTEFEYSDPQRGYLGEIPAMPAASTLRNVTRIQTTDRDWTETTSAPFDMNGDGLRDRLSVNRNTKRWKVQLGLSAAQGGPGYAAAIPWNFCDGSGCTDVGPGSGSPPSNAGYWQLVVVDRGPGFGNPDQVKAQMTVADIVDMDGDGYPDKLERTGNGSWIYRRNQAGDRSRPANERFAFGPPTPWARPDLSTSDTCLICTASHLSWIIPSGKDRNDPSLIIQPNTETVSMLIDINADGRPDHMTHDLQDSEQVWISINKGCDGSGCGFEQPYRTVGGFTADNQREVSYDYATLGESWGTSRNWQNASIVDLNGDGLPDMASVDDGRYLTNDQKEQSDGCWDIVFGNGSGFVPGNQALTHCWSDKLSAWENPPSHMTAEQGASGISLSITQRTLVDLNGDGIVDLLGTDDNRPSGYGLVRFGLGDGHFSRVDVRWDGLGYGLLNLFTGDVNGDGLPDVHSNFPADGVGGVHLHPGAPGLLTRVKNEFGGRTDIEYMSSAEFVGLGAIGGAESLPNSTGPLPGHQWVVSKITVRDGRGGPAITRVIDYAEPRYDVNLRENLGFRQSSELDAANTETATLFHQRLALKGLTEYVERRAANGSLLQAQFTGWQFRTTETPGGRLIPGSLTALPASQTDRLHIGNNSQTFAVTRDFDFTTGNLLKQSDTGGDGVWGTSDDLTRMFTYATNIGSWLLNYPVVVMEQHGGVNAGTTLISYDNRAWPQPPVSGNVTQVDRFFPSGGVNQHHTDSWTYDAYGNIEEFRDSLWHDDGGGTPTRKLDYDGQYNAFPTSISNRLGHVTQYAFDQSLGEVTGVMGPNGDLTCREYDAFGRLSRLAESNGPANGASSSCSTTLARFDFPSVGSASSQYVLERRFTSGSSSLTSRRYFDGLGRVYHEENQAGPSDYVKVTQGWGSRGESVCQTLPYRGGSGPKSCSSQRPYRSTDYDAMLRPTDTWLHPQTGSQRRETNSKYVLANLDGRGEDDLTAVIRTFSDPSPDRLMRAATDSRGEVVYLRESGGGTTLLRRDARGRVTQVDGPDIDLDSGPGGSSEGRDSNVMSIDYDFLGRRTKLTLPGSCGPSSGRNWIFTYDKSNNLTTQTSPEGITLSFNYDKLNRLKRKLYPDSKDDHVYTYDQNTNGIGRLTSIRTRHVTTRFEYLLQGEIDIKKREFPSRPEFVFDYNYDLQDRRTTTTYPDGRTVKIEYSGSFPRRVLDGSFVMADQIDYHASGALRFIVYPGSSGTGTLSSYTFDPDDHRPDTLATIANGQVVQGLQLEHDYAGNPTRSLEIIGSETVLDQLFEYDKLHRIDKVRSFGTLGYGSINYAYDDAGNIRRMGPKRLRYGCSEGGPHAVTEVYVDDVRLGEYEYDRDGAATYRMELKVFEGINMMGMRRDADGRIGRLEKTDQSVCYAYDESGSRVTKMFSSREEPFEVNRLYVDPEYEVDLSNNSHQTHVFLGARRMATILREGL